MAALILEDGAVFTGTFLGDPTPVLGELVFNTAMTGYHEVLTDPSYAGQLVLFTFPTLGIYGIESADAESGRVQAEAMLCHEITGTYSNPQAAMGLQSYLREEGIPAFVGLDTRKLTLHIRDKGAMKAVLFPGDHVDEGHKLLSGYKFPHSMELLRRTTCPEPYTYAEGNLGITIGVLDCGCKRNILRLLAKEGVGVKVFPGETDAETILAAKIDALLISNGPGDPAELTPVVDVLKSLVGKLPMFGICMGHQLLALALGGKTYKLKFGHHGVNHPVKRLTDGRTVITSQNHGYAVAADSMPSDLVRPTHINLNDGTLAGFAGDTLRIRCVQYHPEGAPGPEDAGDFFPELVALVKTWQAGRTNA